MRATIVRPGCTCIVHDSLKILSLGKKSGERTGMDVLEDLKQYQREFQIWLGALQCFMDCAAATAGKDKEKLSQQLVESVQGLLNLQREDYKVPSTLVVEALAIWIDAAEVRSADSDHTLWCQRLAGRSPHIPAGFLQAANADAWQELQMLKIRNRLVDLLRVSGKLQELASVLKSVVGVLSECGHKDFQTDLRKLCSLATIMDVDDRQVEEISRMKTELLTSSPSGEISTWQKALVFFPTGVQLVALVDQEINQVTKMAGLDMDLQKVEESLAKWTGTLTMVNTEQEAAKPVMNETTPSPSHTNQPINPPTCQRPPHQPTTHSPIASMHSGVGIRTCPVGNKNSPIRASSGSWVISSEVMF